MQEPLRIAFRNMEAPLGAEDEVRTTAKVTHTTFVSRRSCRNGGSWSGASRRSITRTNICTSRSATPSMWRSASCKTTPGSCAAT